MPKLSVVMPVFNTEKYLKRSIESILMQTMGDFELILVDDGSTDDSNNICNEYSKIDPRVTVIHKCNEGSGSARNTGIDISTGEFIAFPDSDDWIDINAYEACTKIMNDENVDLLLFGSINTNYNDNLCVLNETKDCLDSVYFNSKTQCRANWINLMVKNYPLDGPSNKLYRKSIIDKYNIRFPQMRRMQDGVFNMMYFDKISSFLAIKKHFYHFTCVDSAIHKKKIPADMLSCIRQYDEYAISMLKIWDMYDSIAEYYMTKNFCDKIQQLIFQYNQLINISSMLSDYKNIRNIVYDNYVSERFFELRKKAPSISKKEWTIINKSILLIYSYKVMSFLKAH